MYIVATKQYENTKKAKSVVKIKKRMRIPSSKRPKTLTEYHSRGFGTQ